MLREMLPGPPSGHSPRRLGGTRDPKRGWFRLGGLLLALAGCGSEGDDPSTADPKARPPVSAAKTDAQADAAAVREGNVAARIDAVREGDVVALLDVLEQSHAIARAATGPHRLTWKVDIDLKGTDSRAEFVPVDSPVVDDQHVADEGTLSWAGTDDEPKWALSQQNDHERGREVVAIGPTMYVAQRHRDFLQQPYEPHVVELWLDDAQHVVYDAVELAAPRLAIATESSDDTITVALSRADAEIDIPPRPSSEGVRRQWRLGTELVAITGSLSIDAHTGLWRAAELEVQYALTGADERRMVGKLTLVASVEPGGAGTDRRARVRPGPARTAALRGRARGAPRRVVSGGRAPCVGHRPRSAVLRRGDRSSICG